MSDPVYLTSEEDLDRAVAGLAGIDVIRVPPTR
jgi:hypothetical protein